MFRTKIRIRQIVVVVFCASLIGTYFRFNPHGQQITERHNGTVNLSNPSKFVVDTSTCKIPEMDPFHPSITSFMKPDFGYPVDCRGKHRAWTYMDGYTLKINSSALHKSGYTEESIYCCYRIIERVEQPLSNFDINADNYMRYSDKCHPLKNGTAQILSEFIRVHCISKSLPVLNDVVYRDFFAIAQPKNDRLISRKLDEWKTKSPSQPPPPNVVIIGVDNNSRMNARRHLPKTLKVLRDLGAVEMLGYTKVGDNTFPNVAPFMSGHSAMDLEQICYNSSLDQDPMDDCPFIWKDFNRSNYITVYAEDAPYLCGFNYLKTGFLRKPADFYLRPLMLAVMTHLPRFDYYHTDCIGRFMTDEFVFNYILDTVKLAVNHSAPIFALGWLTSLAHHNYNNVQFGDISISNFIKSLVQVTNDNTIFFFISDHGQRYGPIRETRQGWYEDKLLCGWVFVPQKFPEWRKVLRSNAARLTSHFDLYKSMADVLQTNDPNFFSPNLNNKTGQSLFQPIPENRTCQEAGIPVNFCACSDLISLNIDDAQVRNAATAAVKHLARIVPQNVCAEPILKSIVKAGQMKTFSKRVYVIMFYTDPGDFLFEVNVEKDDQDKFVITTELLRINKIRRKATCVDIPLLERYCFCK